MIFFLLISYHLLANFQSQVISVPVWIKKILYPVSTEFLELAVELCLDIFGYCSQQSTHVFYIFIYKIHLIAHIFLGCTILYDDSCSWRLIQYIPGSWQSSTHYFYNFLVCMCFQDTLMVFLKCWCINSCSFWKLSKAKGKKEYIQSRAFQKEEDSFLVIMQYFTLISKQFVLMDR